MSRLHTAIQTNDLAAARRLLEEGADPEAPDTEGRTPLMLAAWLGRGELLALLLERGADVDGRNPRGRTALALPGSEPAAVS